MNEIEVAAGMAQTPGYRYASVSADRIFVAGQVPQDASGNICEAGDPHGQAARCLRNLALVLACHEFGVHEIRHLTIYVAGTREDLATAWKAVLDYFRGDVPPASLIGVSVLGHEDQLVEIDATVTRDPGGS